MTRQSTSPADGMVRRSSYLVRVRRRGITRLFEYTATLMQIGTDELVFMSLDNPGVVVRIDKTLIDSYVLLADVDVPA